MSPNPFLGKNWTTILSDMESYSLSGFSDWKMPNLQELFSIYCPVTYPVFGYVECTSSFGGFIILTSTSWGQTPTTLCMALENSGGLIAPNKTSVTASTLPVRVANVSEVI